MTADFRLNWTLPAVSPGPAIKQEKQEQVCELREFDSKPHEVIAWPELPKKLGATFHERKAERAAPPKGKWVPKVGGRFRVVSDAGYYKAGATGVADKVVDFAIWATMDDGQSTVYWSAPYIEPIDTSPAPSGWVEHDGGECPVDRFSPVKYRMRGSSDVEHETPKAENLQWEWDDESWDIVAYRILP